MNFSRTLLVNGAKTALEFPVSVRYANTSAHRPLVMALRKSGGLTPLANYLSIGQMLYRVRSDVNVSSSLVTETAHTVSSILTVKIYRITVSNSETPRQI